jgi:mono/diheme cytochrome c family protein
MKLARLLFVFGISFLLLGCTQTPPPNTAVNNNAAKPPSSPRTEVTPMADQLAAGRKIYTDNCAACHKEDGKGGKIEIEGKSITPDDLTSAKIKAFDDDKIIGYIYKGIEDEGMPAFKDKLSEAEIREVVRYVRAGIQKMPLPAEKK